MKSRGVTISNADDLPQDDSAPEHGVEQVAAENDSFSRRSWTLCTSEMDPSGAVRRAAHSTAADVTDTVVVKSSSSQVRAGDSNTPSSHYEAAICGQLDQLVSHCESKWRITSSNSKLFAQGFLLYQNIAVFVTCAMLVVSCFLYPYGQTFVCTAVFIIVYAFCTTLQGYLFWSRMTETKRRTAAVTRDVIGRWWRRIEAMPHLRGQIPRDRRRVFVQTFAQLPTKAFRMAAVVDDRTYRLKHIHKCLMVRNAKRLDEATLRVRRYHEPHNICKLVDVMEIALDKPAIVLKPLVDRAKPPRLPNLLISNKKFIEEDATTDDSDGEDMEVRTAYGGGNTISVSQHMEFFVHRLFLLVWVVAMALLIGAGIFFYFLVRAPLGEGVFLDPSVALLGLLPVNCIVLNRLLVLYANVYLDKLFHHLVARKSFSPDDRLPRFSFWATLTMMARVIFGRQPSNGGRNPLLFSTSLVDTLGMATVVAMLDQTGIVTDMVLLPVQVLMLRINTHPEDTSSDDEGDVVGYLTERSKLEARERNREMKRQIKRKKFQEERFIELGLRLSSRSDRAVEFTDDKELQRHHAHIHPICLCILLHATARGPTNLETWTEPFRFCDRSLRWSRAMHWVPKACGFRDAVTSRFTVIARVFQIETKAKTGYRSSYPEQAISLLAEDPDGILHLFTIGTPFLISKLCTNHWTGTTVDEFEREEKTEVVHMAKHQWEDGMCLETVALSHRVLPERYRKYVDTLPRGERPGEYCEFFFRDGEEVNDETWQAWTERRRQRKGPRPDGQEADAFGDQPSFPAPAPAGEAAGETTDPPVPVPAMAAEDEEFPVERPWRHARSASLPAVPSLAAQRRNSVQASMPARAMSFGNEPADADHPRTGELEADDLLTSKTFIRLMVTTAQTFLGLVGLRDSVRPNTQQAMNVLDAAGVRCMYFCPGNERQTRSFGSRMGLETDWNCCISLKEDAVALDPHSIRAQLPFGITSIRKHILHVDPIPLQVSLFSHAHGVATRAMLSILQDNHEVVVAVGSVMDHSNVRRFVQADLSIGVLPTRHGPNAVKESVLKHGQIIEPTDFTATKSLNRDLPLYRNVAQLIGCSCNLRAPPTTSILPILTLMIRQARLRMSGIGNCVEFAMHANFLIVMINTVSLLVGAPLLLGPTMTVFELNGIVPILALCCTYTAYSGMDIMKTMPSHHNFFVRCAIFKHSALVWCLRYLPSLLAILALGITASTSMCKVGVIDLINKTSDDCMYAAQGYVALTLNYWLMVHCWTHISRHHPIALNFSLRLGHGKQSMPLFRSFRWAAVSALVSVLSIVVVLIDTPVSALRGAFYPSLAHLLVSLFFPIVLLGLDYPIKRWRDKRCTLMQKFRKLTFGTRLGMHSPRGDYEPEGITYSNNAAGPTSDAGTEITEKAHISCLKRISEAFYRYTTMRHGALELNCVCCDHVGGNYASYHVATTM